MVVQAIPANSLQSPAIDVLTDNTGEDASFTAVVAAVTSAFGDSTRRQIYLFVRDREGVTASEVAQQFSLHSNVARHHLDKLAAGGYLDVTLDHPNNGAGRPSKRYRNSSRAMTMNVPPRPNELVAALLGKALSLLPPEMVEEMAAEVGKEYGRSLAAQMAPGDSQRTMRSAMSAVADALTAHGFAAHADLHDKETTIVRDHCPFGDLVATHPVLCAVDRGMVQGLLEGLCGDAIPVQMSSRALGDASCASVAG